MRPVRAAGEKHCIEPANAPQNRARSPLIPAEHGFEQGTLTIRQVAFVTEPISRSPLALSRTRGLSAAFRRLGHSMPGSLAAVGLRGIGIGVAITQGVPLRSSRVPPKSGLVTPMSNQWQDWIGVDEANYRLDGTEDCWLDELLNCAAPMLSRGVPPLAWSARYTASAFEFTYFARRSSLLLKTTGPHRTSGAVACDRRLDLSRRKVHRIGYRGGLYPVAQRTRQVARNLRRPLPGPADRGWTQRLRAECHLCRLLPRANEAQSDRAQALAAAQRLPGCGHAAARPRALAEPRRRAGRGDTGWLWKAARCAQRGCRALRT